MNALWQQPIPEGPEGDALLRLAYCSVAARPVDSGLLQAILSVARARNADLDITGVLLCDGRMFMQVLEGPARHVLGVMRSVEDDPRHQCIVELFREVPVQERLYPDWRMGFGKTTRMEILGALREARERLMELNDPIAANQVDLLHRLAGTWPAGKDDPLPFAA